MASMPDQEGKNSERWELWGVLPVTKRCWLRAKMEAAGLKIALIDIQWTLVVYPVHDWQNTTWIKGDIWGKNVMHIRGCPSRSGPIRWMDCEVLHAAKSSPKCLVSLSKAFDFSLLKPILTSHVKLQIINNQFCAIHQFSKTLFNPKHILLPLRTNLGSSFREFAAETPTRFAYLSNSCIVFGKFLYLIHGRRCPQTKLIKLSLETQLVFAHRLCWSFHLVETFLDLIISQLEHFFWFTWGNQEVTGFFQAK